MQHFQAELLVHCKCTGRIWNDAITLHEIKMKFQYLRLTNVFKQIYYFHL